MDYENCEEQLGDDFCICDECEVYKYCKILELGYSGNLECIYDDFLYMFMYDEPYEPEYTTEEFEKIIRRKAIEFKKSVNYKKVDWK